MWTHSSFAKKDTLLPTVAPLEIIIPNRSASPSVEQEHELVSALTAFKCLSTVCVCISICSPNPALCRALFDLWQLPPGSLILQVACPSAAAEHVSWWESRKGRKALSEQVNHRGDCNSKCADNRPPGVTLLRREKPSRHYEGHRSGKLCPVKRTRWGEDVTVKTCNPNENQIQSARSWQKAYSTHCISPIVDKRGEAEIMKGAAANPASYHCCQVKTLDLKTVILPCGEKQSALMTSVQFAVVWISYSVSVKRWKRYLDGNLCTRLARPQPKPQFHLYLHYCCLSHPMMITAQPTTPKALKCTCE